MKQHKIIFIEGEKNIDLDTGQRREDWLEDSYWPEVENQYYRGQNSGREDFLGKIIKPVSTRSLFLVVMIICSFLLTRLSYIQITRGDYYQALANQNKTRIKAVNGLRGVIYDRDQTALVRNIPSFSLYAITSDLPADDKSRLVYYQTIYDILSKFNMVEPFAAFAANIEETVNKSVYFNYLPELIKDNLTYDEAVLLMIATVEIPGFYVQAESKREYLISGQSDWPYLSFSHLLGYLGRLTPDDVASVNPDFYLLTDYIGKSGLELQYEELLRGSKGYEEIEVNALGKPVKVIAKKESLPGKNVILSIDFSVQAKVEEILTGYLEKLQLRKAVAIIMNPQTGEIISLVSLPSYDINLFARGILPEEYSQLALDEARPMFNRSISGEYPCGSTFKLVVGAAGLEAGVISAATVINSTGGIRISSWFFPDWRAGGHGRVTITQALADSVNTFFYYTGGGYEDFTGLGVNRIKDYSLKFGLGKELGIDLPGEKNGFVPDPAWKESVKKELWYIGDTYHLSIGQGDLLVTPLQVASFTAAIANGGRVYKPSLVKEIYDPVSARTEVVTPRILSENFIKEENINLVRGGLKAAVRYGSARVLAGHKYDIAGKTGTAQWHTQKEPHAWFTGFAPYDNPGVVVTVLVEEAGEGSAVAVPVAAEIFGYLWAEKNQPENSE